MFLKLQNSMDYDCVQLNIQAWIKESFDVECFTFVTLHLKWIEMCGLVFFIFLTPGAEFQ